MVMRPLSGHHDQDEHGRERERHKITLRRHALTVKADQIRAGTIWPTGSATSPSSPSSPARPSSKRRGGLTVAKRVDGSRALSTLVVIDPKRRSSRRQGGRPLVKLIDGTAGGIRHRPLGDDRLQVGALIQVPRDGRKWAPAEMLAHPVEARRPATSRAACRAWPSCSNLAVPGTREHAGGSPAPCRSARETKGKVRLQITDPADGKVWDELILKKERAGARGPGRQ